MKTTRKIAVLILIALALGTTAQLAFGEKGSAGPGEGYRRDRAVEENYSLPEMNLSSTPAAPVETEAGMFEEEIGIEIWMTAPFETPYLEEELVLEVWMTEPFDTCLEEPEQELEAWMRIPFEKPAEGERLCLEDWMSVPFTLPAEYKLVRLLTAARW